MGKTLFLVLIMFTTLTAKGNISSNVPFSIPNHFTVGSYNLYGLKNEKELKKDLNALPDVQIWAFQEVEDTYSQVEERILNLLPPGKWYLFTQKVNLVNEKKGIWEGQVIASRFPFESTEIIPLSHSNEKDRVALIANFKTENGETFFFTNTDHEVSVFSTDFYDRKKQLLSLVDHFKQTNAIGIITGDFNTTGKQDEIDKTEEILSEANFVRSKPSDNDPYTFKKFIIKEELDHFFSRGITTSLKYRYNKRKGSDHYPIYTAINL